MTARREELLEKAYGFVLEHGLADLSLRPLARAIGSSPRVLLYLFESKDGLVRELLARARHDELAALQGVDGEGLEAVTATLWEWLSAPRAPAAAGALGGGVRALAGRPRTARGPASPGRPSRTGSTCWPRPSRRGTPDQGGCAERTRALALLRGALLDLLATGDEARVAAALRQRSDHGRTRAALR